MNPGPESLALRPARADELEFLYRVYASTRAQEMAAVPWSNEQKESFLRFQFQAQHSYYHSAFPSASYDVIERSGQLIGRLYVDRRADEVRILDIAILPEFRGEGIGTALLREIQDEAGRADKPVRIHVEHHNPAMRLYERLGFRNIEDRGSHAFLEWTPPKR